MVGDGGAGRRSSSAGARASCGIVLCGGRSTRMGRDKARLDLEGRSLLERAIRVLEPVCERVVLACGPDERYAELGLELRRDRFEDGGPLAGIEAGLAAAGDGYALVLAVDMPRATSEVFRALLDRRVEEGVTGPEPLCGVYHARLAGPVAELLARGERKVTTFVDRRDASGRTARVAWIDERRFERTSPACSTNLNTPADLESARSASEPPSEVARERGAPTARERGMDREAAS